MRKLFWLVLALLVVVVAPAARADSFIYSYSDSGAGFSFTTEAIPAVTASGTTVPAADLTATSTSLSTAGCTITSVVLNYSGNGETQTNFTGSGCTAISSLNLIDYTSFALSDYSTPGTYGGYGDILVVTAAVTAPEPNSLLQMLIGMGVLTFGVCWGRIGHAGRLAA